MEFIKEAMSDGMRVLDETDVATIARPAAILAGSLYGIPGISILADAIVTLIATCDGIPKQKYVVYTPC